METGKEWSTNFFNSLKELALENERLKQNVENSNRYERLVEKEMQFFKEQNSYKFERLAYLEKENADLKETVRTVGRENDELKIEVDRLAEAQIEFIRQSLEIKKENDRLHIRLGELNTSLRANIGRLIELEEDTKAYRQLLKENLAKDSPEDKPQK